MKKSDIKWFERRGFTWEHPGYINGDLGDGVSFTVAHSDPKWPGVFTVQIVLGEDAEYIGGMNFATREGVMRYFNELNPLKEKVAKVFARLLKESLTRLQWDEMRAKNRVAFDAGDFMTCASHDYCDANMVMDGALRFLGFAALLDAEDWASNEKKVGIWNRSWDFAKKTYLTEVS